MTDATKHSANENLNKQNQRTGGCKCKKSACLMKFWYNNERTAGSFVNASIAAISQNKIKRLGPKSSRGRGSVLLAADKESFKLLLVYIVRRVVNTMLGRFGDIWFR
jgi:hypothetical protein